MFFFYFSFPKFYPKFTKLKKYKNISKKGEIDAKMAQSGLPQRRSNFTSRGEIGVKGGEIGLDMPYHKHNLISPPI
jgi:hypothetical protein